MAAGNNVTTVFYPGQLLKAKTFFRAYALNKDLRIIKPFDVFLLLDLRKIENPKNHMEILLPYKTTLLTSDGLVVESVWEIPFCDGAFQFSHENDVIVEPVL